MRILDLKQLIERFIETGLESFQKETIKDLPTVRAVAAKGTLLGERAAQVQEWLNYYRVVRYFPTETTRELAGKVIEFAGDLPPGRTLTGEAEILSEYNKLRAYLQPLAPPAPKTGLPRKVTSLTSKALWLCYPDCVPIFDGNAVRALQMICRIGDIRPEPAQTDYELFVDAWLQVYATVKPAIDQANLNGYPYKVRVLDGLLWYLGRPTFDLSTTASNQAADLV